MAETTDFRIQNDFTLTVADDSGTPKTYSFRIEPGVGSVKVQAEAFADVQQMTSAGVMTGIPRKGTQARHAEFQVSKARVNDPGVNAAEAVAIDIAGNDGYFASTWVSTVLGVDRKAMDATYTAAARSGGATGITYTIADAWIVEESVDEEHTPEGLFVSFVIRGNAMTRTRVT